ncbi:unnamed protein product [Trichobilharzia regenti]|nr:unnamed protein product [Trichobilharzia regenti]
MPDISEYRLGSACRVSSLTQLKDETDTSPSNQDILHKKSNSAKESTNIVLHDNGANSPSAVDYISHANSSSENAACCCRESISKLMFCACV